MVADLQDVAHGFKGVLEFAVFINDDEAAEADFEKDVAHEEVGEGRGSRVSDVIAEDKASEVAHGSHKVSGEAFESDVFIGYFAGRPEIDVNDVEGRSDGP
jgi:hypothetical protein